MTYRRDPYASWQAMKNRCLNKNELRYKDYGGRGITICDKWLKFENFYRDMGNAPEGMTLDRIDNNGNYCKENCKWSTRIEQQNNTRQNHLITYKGKTQTIAQWSRELNIGYQTLYNRIKYGRQIERALTNKTGKEKSNMTKTFTLCFPDEFVHRKFKTICVVENVTMNQKLLELIKKCIEEKDKK